MREEGRVGCVRQPGHKQCDDGDWSLAKIHISSYLPTKFDAITAGN